MEDRETARMRKYGESKTNLVMMATVPHVTSGLGLRKLQADGFLLTRVYMCSHQLSHCAGHCVLCNMWEDVYRKRYKFSRMFKSCCLV